MEKLKKIDIHVHAVPEPFVERRHVGGTFTTPAQLREMYDIIGVEKALLLPTGPYAASLTDTVSMREAYHMVQDHPDTFGWWFCTVNPAMGENAPDEDLSFYINQFKAKGARGIGEITENRYFDDPYMLNLFDHAQACQMPITFHIGNMGRDYGLVDELGLPRLEKTLRRYPGIIFLGHSQKFWAEISADCTEEGRRGYPTGKVTPGRVVRLMREYPNLCGDLSAGSGYNALARDPDFAYAFLEEFQDRLFYGTDICDPRNINNPMIKLAGFLDEAMEKGYISYGAYEKVSRGNALKLLS